MASLRLRTPEGLNAWLNDPEAPLWERPGPTARQVRHDVLGTVAFAGVALFMILVSKSMGMTVEGEETWRAYVAVAAMILPLAMRRRFPLVVLLASSALFLALSYLSPEASVQLSFQVAYFAALYAAVAWAPDRRGLWIAMGLVLLTMTLWLVIMFTMAAGYAGLVEGDDAVDGPLPQPTAAVLYTSVMNLAYFGGAILIGRASWRAALQRERLTEQAGRIRKQSAEIARRAVVDERMRIARELHDVVAHHVSVIGVQAGATRKVLAKDPAAATDGLRTIEEASRHAVGEMRSLLGVLRSETQAARDGHQAGERNPEPRLADVHQLLADHQHTGVALDLVVTEEHDGDLEHLPGPVSLSLYRTVQEALANVVRHSTATQALVTVRTGSHDTGADEAAGERTAEERWAEVEIIDNGLPRHDTAGSGYGIRGIRERVSLHRGEADIGPRQTVRGWRVRVRLPLRGYVSAPQPRSHPELQLQPGPEPQHQRVALERTAVQGQGSLA